MAAGYCLTLAGTLAYRSRSVPRLYEELEGYQAEQRATRARLREMLAHK